jgi:hypothetical protein
MVGQESKRPVSIKKSVDDAPAPVVARLDFCVVDPDRMARCFQVSADSLNQRRVLIMTVAQEYFHGPSCPERSAEATG